MVGHDGIGAEFILAQQHTTPQRCGHDAGDWLPSQIYGPERAESRYRSIQTNAEPDGRRIHGLWETAVKMPCHEKPLSFRMAVRQTAAELSHVNQWVMGGQTLKVTAKRRDESRRGRHECLRHIQPPAP
jgi:hypothetical protein